ncbi:type II toxin-antitoxin system SpoIISA family toxin [Lentibacillus salinarum]|uniref:Type II toxin-antitoxin system SpoIISA family toxin n=1 Tax=Lentibacillus salinarum TaxID=446820 RepID=A0ABW3ZZJ0_9BACI
MEKFFIVGMWVIFVLLSCYIFIYWRNREAVKDKDTIRKTWYLLICF